MKISVGLGTYGSRINELKRLFDSLEKQTYKDFELMIASQTNHEIIADMLKGYSFKYQHFIATGVGPSNSKNAIVDHMDGNIGTFADDDGWYPEDSFERIVEIFKKDEPELAFFQNKEPISGRQIRVYPKEASKSVTKLQLLNQMSLDIFFNLDRIELVKFDERFGVNAQYGSGEENIFLVDLYNKGYRRLYYYPIIMAYHPTKDNNYMDEKSFIDKGALFKRLFGFGQGLLLCAAFGLKKRPLVKENNDGRFWSIYFRMLGSFLSFKN